MDFLAGHLLLFFGGRSLRDRRGCIFDEGRGEEALLVGAKMQPQPPPIVKRLLGKNLVTGLKGEILNSLAVLRRLECMQGLDGEAGH
jgi:hypothetical protein